MPTWIERHAQLDQVARKQLFFVGGAPRSGTTWVQQILDSHPDVSCRGEGLFQQQLASLIDTALVQRRQALEIKNNGLFRHTGGYPPPTPEDADHLVGEAILLALHHQSAAKPCRAVGEKTPENVFFFPRLKRLFPRAKFVGVARDPRDVLTSAWHLFHKPAPGEDILQAKAQFVRMALPSLEQGFRAMAELERQYPGDCHIVTYEVLQRDPQAGVAALFGFLGVATDAEIVADSVQRTRFAALNGGREAGIEQTQSFFRKGVVGDWRLTLTPDLGQAIVQTLNGAFAHFGWPI